MFTKNVMRSHGYVPLLRCNNLWRHGSCAGTGGRAARLRAHIRYGIDYDEEQALPPLQNGTAGV
jgi:hypothetical protein